MSGTYGALLSVYTDEFTSGWQQAMATASYKFRTTESISHLTTALVAVSGYAKQADTLIDGVGAGTLTRKAAAAEAASLEMLLTAKMKGIGSLLAAVQTLDGQNLKKAASIDQTGLKTLAGKLKSGVDAQLLANLKTIVVKVTTGLAASLKGAGDSTESKTSDINAATEKALSALNKATGFINQSNLDDTRELLGSSTAFWLADGTK